jgi:pimeloyl-ACP methyl ester carboxylesterase
MPHIDRDGVHLFYEVHGPAESTHRPLLLTHGYSATAEMWTPNIASLSAIRQVITWDIRGHGRSDSPDDPTLYSEALAVEDMAALLDTVGLEQAIVGGLSLGGYLSLAFYLRHPTRVTALVLCDTGPGYRRDEPRAEWNAMATRWADDFDRRGLEALTGSAEVRASNHRSPLGLALAARGILRQHDPRVMESLPFIAVPALVLVGADDKAFLAAADVMAAKIPGATKIVVADAGHAANIDQPEAFNRAVIDFLDDL